MDGMKMEYEAGTRFGNLERFPADASFGDGCVFGRGCTFGDGCVFGEYCEFGMGGKFGERCAFGSGCSFGKECVFGKAAKFQSRCDLGVGCEFGEGCKFGDGSTLRSNCQVGAFASFGNNCSLKSRIRVKICCEFGNNCSFADTFHALEGGCKFGNGCSFRAGLRTANDARFGSGCSFGQEAKFGPRCEFGPRCTFEWGTDFGKRALICEGCTIVGERIFPSAASSCSVEGTMYGGSVNSVVLEDGRVLVTDFPGGPGSRRCGDLERFRKWAKLCFGRENAGPPNHRWSELEGVKGEQWAVKRGMILSEYLMLADFLEARGRMVAGCGLPKAPTVSPARNDYHVSWRHTI
jgi:acetyltransferase-like isoleucine patch superfamily enzyme